ncbi:MAG TPA: hypothetical protein VF303_04825 [Candidatus Nanoarchaeia archaeon]
MELDDLFDFSKLEHKELFEGAVNLWDPLTRLEKYLESVCDGELIVGKNTTIHSSAEIKGLAIIGDGVEIRNNVLLREGVVIGDGCVIGHASEIKHSIILANSKIPHLNYVGDSIVGNDVNLGAGVILANYKAGVKKLEVEIGSGKISSKLKKLGAFVGDGVKIGSNTVCNPGTIIGKNTLIYPLCAVRGTIEANKIVKCKMELVIEKKI